MHIKFKSCITSKALFYLPLFVKQYFIVVYIYWYVPHLCATSISFPDLPANHLIRYLNTFPQLLSICRQTDECQEFLTYLLSSQKLAMNETSFELCWGHEENCFSKVRFQTPNCTIHNLIKDMESQVNTFYRQADFGYIRQQVNSLKLICIPHLRTDSSLECSQYLQFCRGRHLKFDFRALAHRTEHIRYHMDVLKIGEIEAYCNLNLSMLNTQMDHMGALQSWAPEMRNLIESLVSLHRNHDECDIIVSIPTYIMKIDATFNMYHHFCDFFNLYATLFVNQSHPSVFDTNIQIFIWETYPYDSPFAVIFKAFSHNTVWTLSDVSGQRVCFRNVVLSLLPRMLFGLYYNTPIIHGCRNSGLFRAFSEFVLHRLKVSYQPPHKTKLRITFLSRRTKYRRVLNELELLQEIGNNENYLVTNISYDRGIDFLDQLHITRNTDILIGMHGAGLTHLLFLPNWASVFELYNCDDANCYKDLSRLRGLNYVTWEALNLIYPEDQGHHPEIGAHAKFTNYAFDPKEFSRLVAKAADYVRTNKEYCELTEQCLKYSNDKIKQNKYEL